MNKKKIDLFLLSVYFLTVVFIWGASPEMIRGAERVPTAEGEAVERPEKKTAEEKKLSLLSAKFRQNEDGSLISELKIKDFDSKKKLKIKLLLADAEKPFKTVYKADAEAKEDLSLDIPFEVKDSELYRWKIEVTQGKKKASYNGKEPIYLQGEFEKEILLQPSVRFIDENLVASWTDEGERNYRIGIYEKESLRLLEEHFTDRKEVSLSLKTKEKNLLFSVARFSEGLKGAFSLVEVPDRELPNTLVSFDKGRKSNKDRYEVDIIYTGNCLVSIDVNDKAYYTNSSEQGRFSLKLPDGNNIIKVKVVSDNGNIKNFAGEVFVDTVFPKITLDSGLDGAVTGDGFIAIGGSCDERALLTLNGKELVLDEENHFHTNLNLKEGENEIKIVAVDSVGNTSNLRAVVKRETEHEPDIRVVILIASTFGIIFLAYFVTFVKWISLRRNRKS